MSADESFVWLGPNRDRGGYGNVARNFLRGLTEQGARVVPQQLGPSHADIGARDEALLAGLTAPATREETLVVHHTPSFLREAVPQLRGQWNGTIAACTIAETDRLPDDWVEGCNLADEVWVPTTFNELTFAASGVDPAKLRLVPYGLDVEAWDPAGPRAEGLAPDDHTVFVYTFAFDWRKGFDVLLTAYLDAFTRDDKVTLVLKVYDPAGGASGSLRGLLAESVAHHVDLFRTDLPRVVVLDQPLPRDELAAIYRRADLYISTDRANGWGMPCMESMALARATATIDWSGSTEFMTADTSLLIPPGALVPVDRRLAEERPLYAGQRWAAVRVEDVQDVLRAAASRDVDLEALGARGREAILDRWTCAHAGDYILGRDSGAYSRRPGLTERLRPLVGLSAEPPLADARAHVLVCDWIEPEWREALGAYVDAFAPDDPVTLCVWAPDGTDEATVGGSVVAALAERGVEPADAPDVVVAACDRGDVLADPTVRGFVGPFTRAGAERSLPAAAAALRDAAAVVAAAP